MADIAGGQFLYDATTIGQLDTAFAKIVRVNYEKPFVEALSRDTFAFKLFKHRNVTDAFTRWKVHHTGNSAEWYDEDDAYAAAGEQLYEGAELNQRMVRVNVKFSNIAEAASAGDGAWINRRLDELEKAMVDLRDAINSAILDDAVATKAIECLGTAISASGTYATIDRSSATYWQSHSQANSGTARALTLALMNTAWRNLQKPERGANISHILTDPKIVDDYHALSDGRRQFMGSTSKGGNDTNLGYGTAWYKDVPVLGVQKFPLDTNSNTRMYFVDSSVFSIDMLKAITTDEISTTTDTKQYAIKSYLQFVCKEPHKNAVILDLTP